MRRDGSVVQLFCAPSSFKVVWKWLTISMNPKNTTFCTGSYIQYALHCKTVRQYRLRSLLFTEVKCHDHVSGV